MKAQTLYLSAYICLMLVLGGCATPQAALDQANNGAALTVAFQSELEKFRSVQIEVAKSRIDSIRTQQARMMTYESGSAMDERIALLSNKGEIQAMYAKLKDLADAKIKDEAILKVKLIEADELLAKIVSPYSVSSANLEKTQKALATIGEELTHKERIRLVTNLVNSINTVVKENKEKIDKIAVNEEKPVQSPAR